MLDHNRKTDRGGTGEAPPATLDPTGLVTVAEAARALRLSQRYVRRLITAGHMPVVRFGRSVRIARGEVERLVREGSGFSNIATGSRNNQMLG